jgi:hypothetical protein
MPTLTPSKVVSNTFDGDHSAGVLPWASTTLDETYGNCASGISVVRRYAWPRSKLWFPRPSRPIPIMFMTSIVGVSPKKAEIGGVAPTESPAAIVSDPCGASARYQSNHGFRNAEPPMLKLGLTAPPPLRLSAVSASGISWPW